ncbi:MAG: PRC-barrel domain-containing protein [Chloroflexi bacterium]|nr:PRC-barrel domain-containing protein [Chloroflexota bacterium]
MRASALKGLAVLSINEGVRLGRVGDVLYDPRARRVAAFVLEPADGHRLFGRAPRQYVLYGAVQSIGDAVTVGSSEAVLRDQEATQLEDLASLDTLHGVKVVDASGKLVGEVEDVELDPRDGSFVALCVRHGGVLGLGAETYEVPAASVHSFGRDAVMIEPLNLDS